MPKVSVIIPIYNTDKYMKKCLDSVLAQSLKDIEIILVDDGSKDGSWSICNKYKKDHSNVIIIHQENKGVASARNTGLRYATGEYIGFVDSDDYICATMYEKLYSIATEKNVEVVSCKYATINEDDTDLKLGPSYLPANQLLTNQDMKKLISEDCTGRILWFAVKSIYKKELLLEDGVKFRSDNNLEDILFNLEVLCTAKTCWFIDEVMYYYVQTSDSVIRGNYKENLHERLNGCYLERKKISTINQLSGYEKALFSYNMTHTIVILLLNEMKNSNSCIDRVRTLKQLRATELVTETFRNETVKLIHSNIKYAALLLKFRCYLVLSIVLKW